MLYTKFISKNFLTCAGITDNEWLVIRFGPHIFYDLSYGSELYFLWAIHNEAARERCEILLSWYINELEIKPIRLSQTKLGALQTAINL